MILHCLNPLLLVIQGQLSEMDLPDRFHGSLLKGMQLLAQDGVTIPVGNRDDQPGLSNTALDLIKNPTRLPILLLPF